MTKTAKKTEAAVETNAASMIETLQNKIEVPAAAREFVARNAAAAKDRAETMHDGAVKLAGGVEKAVVSMIGGYANFSRGLIDAAFANVSHALNTVEKIAAAKSAKEAVQVQIDFVRDNARDNYERVREAAEAARNAAAEGAETVKDGIAKVWPGQKAA